jgi:hypothetical protein
LDRVLFGQTGREAVEDSLTLIVINERTERARDEVFVRVNLFLVVDDRRESETMARASTLPRGWKRSLSPAAS